MPDKPKPVACYTKILIGDVAIVLYRERDETLRNEIRQRTGREFLLAAYPETYPDLSAMRGPRRR
jgi:hypothetical protein